MADNKVEIILDVTDKGSVVVKRFGGTNLSVVKKIRTAFGGLSRGIIKGLGGAIKGIGARLVSLKTLAVGALAGWGLKRLAEGFIKTGSSMDQLKISLDTITKGKGEEWFQRLNEWALKMPVNTEKAIQSFTMMRAMGLEPTIKDMTTLVDTTSALGGQSDTLEGIARALGQIQTKGKVSAEELMQLAERGIPAYEILREKLGLTSEQLGNIGKSGVEAGVAVQALLEGMAERFGGQSEKIQNKWAGLMESLKSYWTEFKRMVMESGVMVTLETIFGNLIQTVDRLHQEGKLKAWAKETGEFVVNVTKEGAGRILDAFKLLVTGAELVGQSWLALNVSWNAVVGTVSAGAAIILGIYRDIVRGWEMVISFGGLWRNALVKDTEVGRAKLEGLIKKLVEFTTISGDMAAEYQKALNNIGGGFDTLRGKVDKIKGTVAGFFKSTADTIKNTVPKFKIDPVAIDQLEDVKKKAKDTADAIENMKPTFSVEPSVKTAAPATTGAFLRTGKGPSAPLLPFISKEQLQAEVALWSKPHLWSVSPAWKAKVFAEMRERGMSIPPITYQSGTGPQGLPYTGLFRGHKGEIVKSPAESDAERADRTGNTYNITIAPQMMTGDRAAARAVAVEIREALKELDNRWS